MSEDFKLFCKELGVCILGLGGIVLFFVVLASFQP